MSALGQEQTSREQALMSALPLKADIRCKNKSSRVSFRRHRQLCTFIGKLPAGHIQYV